MIYHSCPISPSQSHALAQGITSLHSTLFSAPSSFVNISFLSSPSSTYVSSNPVATNFLHAHLRPRGPANAPRLQTLVTTIMKLWAEHVAQDETSEGRLDDPRGLHNVFVFEDLVAGAEQGFVLPKAGEEEVWVKDNWEKFERRAKEGDEAVGKMMEEIEEKE
ncbi:hypothetical protein DE146DRAFT_615146 [Phaeosphaeria sp. MPI-PUGE-AT-0046c]|nr:hypothetical protein DE146DRAFT_615146 [Phaeosphaeria sp. MPI-PUGE-AT-0046c]